MKKDKNFELKSFYITKTTKPPFGSFFGWGDDDDNDNNNNDGLIRLLPPPLPLGAAGETPASTPIDVESGPPLPPTPAWRRRDPAAAMEGPVPSRALMETNGKPMVKWYRNEYSFIPNQNMWVLKIH